MNKETKLQFVELFEAASDEIGIEETPAFDSVDFMPIVSDRHAHTDAVLALAGDIASECPVNDAPEIDAMAEKAQMLETSD